MRIDVESFIKQDLININEEEMALQRDLKDLHRNTKDNIKEVYNKYDIKTDYKSSAEIIGD